MSMVKAKEIETAFFHSLGNPKGHMFISFVLKISIITSPTTTGFSLGCLHMGTSGGGQSINVGGTHEGGHRPYGGPNFDRLYHKLKVLLLLSCNYMMQFISFVIAFKFTQ